MVKVWFLALRPWSFTASAIPVTLGAILAYTFEGTFSFGLYLLTLFGGTLLHSGTNLINTYGDFIAGVDTIESAETCPQLVRNILKPEQMKNAGIIAFGMAALLGIYFVYLRGWPMLFLGLIGILGGYTYTAGPLPYKYQGLGSLLVFFLMGPLMVLGSHYVQTGVFNENVIWASLPVGFLVSGILHANDLRDIDYDQRAGIKTLALILGEKLAFPFYYLLNIAAFASLLFLIIFNILPVSSILPFLLIPKLGKILKNAHISRLGNKDTLTFLEANSAKFHFQFGSMFIAGLLINIII